MSKPIPGYPGCVISQYAVWHEQDNERILAMVIPDSWSSVWETQGQSWAWASGPRSPEELTIFDKTWEGTQSITSSATASNLFEEKTRLLLLFSINLDYKTTHSALVHLYWYEMLCFNSHSHPILRIDIEFKLCIDAAYLFTELIADLRSIENKSRSSNRKRSLASAECIWL